MKKRTLSIIMALLMLLMSSCTVKKDAEGLVSSNNSEVTTQETSAEIDEQNASTENEDTIEFFKSDDDTYVIENSYVSLKYPVKWQDYVTSTVTEDDMSCSVAFTAQLDGRSIELYTVIIADESSGYFLGTVKTEVGDKNVYLIDQYDETVEELSDELQTKYYGMHSDVNVIISKLIYDNGMVIS